MNVVFLLGNGFDKAIGLATGYYDFYTWYLKQSNNSNEIKKLKDAIQKSMVSGDMNWSDFEIAMGQFTAEFDDRDKFISCFKSARDSLMKYLQEVYNNKKLDDEDFLMSAAYRLDELSQMFYKDFEETEKKRFEKIGSMEDIVINYISFNYTPFLEEGNSDMVSFANRFWQRSHDNTKCIVGEFMNVHGLINNDPILGVNDISQIANESFRTDREIVELIVKSEADRKSNHKWRERACNIIQNSDIVCIYGMSLGNTDLFWWEQLAEWFEKDEKHELVIYCYPDSKRDIKTQEDELKGRISKHLTGNRLEADILVDSSEKRMTVKFVHLKAESTIETSIFAKPCVCSTSDIKMENDI